MTENEGYEQVMACVMATMPDEIGTVRFKAYLAPENDYMSAAASYAVADGALVEAPVEDVFPDLFALLVTLRRFQQGDSTTPWLTADMTYKPSTNRFTASYGYERPVDGTVTFTVPER